MFSGPYFGNISPSNVSLSSDATDGVARSPIPLNYCLDKTVQQQPGETSFESFSSGTVHPSNANSSPDIWRDASCVEVDDTTHELAGSSVARTGNSFSSDHTDSEPSAGRIVLNVTGLHGIDLDSRDTIVSSSSGASSLQAPRTAHHLRTDVASYQDNFHTNVVSTETFSSCKSPSAPHQLELVFGSSADEDVNLDLSSSPPTSSPPLLFSSSSLPSSQSSAIDPIEDPASPKQEGGVVEEEPSVQQTAEDPDDAEYIDTYATSDSSSPIVASSHLAFQTPCSTSELEPSLSAHILADDYASSQDIEVDGECEGLSQLLLDSDSIQMEEASPVSSPQSASSIFLLSSPPPEQPSSSTLESPVEDAETSSQADHDIDEVLTSDKSSVFSPEPTPKGTYPKLVHLELPMFDLPSQSILGKRRVEDESPDVHSPQPWKDQEPFVISDSMAAKESTLPNPKRSTIASQKLQHKKLTTPFRSPVLKRPKIDLAPTKKSSAPSLTPSTEIRKTSIEPNAPSVALPEPDTTDTKKRHRTQRAAAPFKSPVTTDTSSKMVSSVRMTPTIQALERKLQLLKRAVKVKQDGDEKTLETLVKKWTEAGREVAWEVWELVRDNTSSDNRDWGKTKSQEKLGKAAFEDSWGWNEKNTDKSHTSRENERNWGWDVVPLGTANDLMDETNPIQTPKATDSCRYEDEDMDDQKQDTLGTMLMQLGIALETLGWNEEEGTFQDE